MIISWTILTFKKLGGNMALSHDLPDPASCTTKKISARVDYWICMVPEPDYCPYILKICGLDICAIASKSATNLKRKIEEKRIAVRYKDKSVGMVSRKLLKDLIESEKIAAFERATGWVDLEKDPTLRKSTEWKFKGLQRRDDRERNAENPAQPPIYPEKVIP